MIAEFGFRNAGGKTACIVVDFRIQCRTMQSTIRNPKNQDML
jgi:hypothetical protein